ncbi:MAG: DUF4326 domain-containing protein [Mesorhizobium sp.]|nr:MAG: DUF4326 domain-containing protein [Mesorhizobium sp.]
MTAPIRIQLSRAKGWRMPDNTVKVDRTTKWGNPFDFRKSECCWIALSYGCRGDRLGRQEASVKAFREWIAPGEGRRTVSIELQPGFGSGRKRVPAGPKIEAGLAPDLRDVASALRGKNLGCWCKIGEPCHADVLLELANKVTCDEVAP